MSCWSVNSFDFSREKLHERFSARLLDKFQEKTKPEKPHDIVSILIKSGCITMELYCITVVP